MVSFFFLFSIYVVFNLTFHLAQIQHLAQGILSDTHTLFPLWSMTICTNTHLPTPTGWSMILSSKEDHTAVRWKSPGHKNTFHFFYGKSWCFFHLPAYLYLGAQSIRSEVRLIFISCVASENSRQQSFEDSCTRGGGWGSVEGGLTKQIHRRYSKTVFRVNWPSNEAVWGRGARTGEGGGTFFPLHPPCLPVLSALVYVFGVTPLCALYKPAAC